MEKRFRLAVYDNPRTMAREAWENGRVVAFVSSALVATTDYRRSDWLPFYLNYGDWESGRIRGDADAIEQ